MKITEPKTPAGTVIPLPNLTAWPVGSGWKVKIDGRLRRVSDETIHRAGGKARIRGTQYTIDNGGRVRPITK